MTAIAFVVFTVIAVIGFVKLSPTMHFETRADRDILLVSQFTYAALCGATLYSIISGGFLTVSFLILATIVFFLVTGVIKNRILAL